jgi:chaperonin GroEL
MKIVNKNIQEVIKIAINKAVDIISPTYGPASNKVIIKTQFHSTICDDGVQIARDLNLPNETEDAIWSKAKEVAIQTNDRSGDGTTSSLIMLRAIINECAKARNKSSRQMEIELKKAVEEVKKLLLSQSVTIKSKEDLRKVSRISFDDKKIADVIADTWYELGVDGVITVEKSQTMETVSEMASGVTLNKGYASPYMVNDQQRMEVVIENPLLLLSDYDLSNAEQIIPILNKVLESGKNRLVVIAPKIDQHALATLIVNLPHIQNPQTGQVGRLQAVAVELPPTEREAILEDLATLTGAKVISESKGSNMLDVSLDDLGRCERFIAKKDSSIIIKPKGSKKAISEASEAYKANAVRENDPKVKKAYQERLARLTGKIAVIKVGGMTETEHRALKYKVEDAVNAVKVAFKGGVVRGSGLALSSCVTSSPILNIALQAPNAVLMENCDLPPVMLKKSDDAYNIATGEQGHFMSVGVVDPVEVLIAGVESAVSIACVLITATAIIIQPKDK